MILNKRVLLICRESYSFPLFFIAERLLKDNNIVGAFFIYPEESSYKKCYYNENTYYAFKERLPEVQLYGLEAFSKEFDIRMGRDIKCDIGFLSKVEEEYSFFKNLNLQLMSSQSTTRQYHSRFYFNHSTQKENHLYLEMGYKEVLRVLDVFEPDVILDLEDSELLRTILNEVAHKRNIPYINMDYPRFEKYKIPTFNLGLSIDGFLEKQYLQGLAADEDELKNELLYIDNLKRSDRIMSSEFKGTITSTYKPMSIWYLLKFILIKCLYFFNVYIYRRNAKLFVKRNIIYSSPIKHLFFYLKVELKKQFLFRKNRYFESPIANEVYVYMPLHLIPESTTFVKAPYYVNELALIEQISKSLPINWKLYVKEHQAMVGERKLKFYNRIKRFSNVRLVQFNYYDDPKPWIDNSVGIVTISGSASFEAALLGKKSIVFANVPFLLIDGVTKSNSMESLYSLISNLGTIDNVKSCASYLAAVKSVGTEIDIKYLLTESELVLNGDIESSPKFQENISLLLSFYNRAFTSYCTGVDGYVKTSNESV
jgi:hypothetical protein